MQVCVLISQNQAAEECMMSGNCLNVSPVLFLNTICFTGLFPGAVLVAQWRAAVVPGQGDVLMRGFYTQLARQELPLSFQQCWLCSSIDKCKGCRAGVCPSSRAALPCGRREVSGVSLLSKPLMLWWLPWPHLRCCDCRVAQECLWSCLFLFLVSDHLNGRWNDEF